MGKIMKNKIIVVKIKGKKETLIKINNIWVYKYRRCECICNERILFRKSQMKNGIPKFKLGHHRKGQKLSIKTRKKMRKARIGKNNPMFGLLGKDNPNFGSKRTKVQKERISKSSSGENNSMYGTHWTRKRKKHHSKLMKKYYREHPEISEQIRNRQIGKYDSKETRKKKSVAKSGKNNPMFGRPSPKCTWRGKGCYYNSPLQGKIWLRSTYELAYAKYLDKKRILWKYEYKRFKLSNGTTYCPDFYLIKKNKYVEIKGYMRQNALRKIKLFKKEYPDIKFKILFFEDLIIKNAIS